MMDVDGCDDDMLGAGDDELPREEWAISEHLLATGWKDSRKGSIDLAQVSILMEEIDSERKWNEVGGKEEEGRAGDEWL
jgi:hypothetical protein